MEKLKIDSDDEKYVGWYFQELKEVGIIKDFKRAESYTLNKNLIINYQEIKQLVTKTKVIEKSQTLILNKVYTPDYEVLWLKGENTKKLVQILKPEIRITKIFICQLLKGEFTSIIEVKPIHDQNNMTRLFKTNQAIVWDSYDIYVNLITYQELFEATFTPLKYIIEEGSYKNNTKHGKKGDNKIKWKVRTLEEYLQF